MVLGPINQMVTPCSFVPKSKKVWEYERPLKEEEVTNAASHSGWYSEVSDWHSFTMDIWYRSRWIRWKTRNWETSDGWTDIPFNQGIPHWGNFSVVGKITTQVEDQENTTIIKIRFEGPNKRTDDFGNYRRTDQRGLKIKNWIDCQASPNRLINLVNFTLKQIFSIYR